MKSRAIGIFLYFGIICFGHAAEISFNGGHNTLVSEGARVVSAIDNGEILTITYHFRNMIDSSIIMESNVILLSNNREIAIKYLQGKLNPSEALDSIRMYGALDIGPGQYESESRYLHFFKSAPGYENFHSKDHKIVFVAPKREMPVNKEVVLDISKPVSDADKAKTFYQRALKLYAKFPETNGWRLWLKKAEELDHPDALKIVKMLENPNQIERDEALRILADAANRLID